MIGLQNVVVGLGCVGFFPIRPLQRQLALLVQQGSVHASHLGELNVLRHIVPNGESNLELENSEARGVFVVENLRMDSVYSFQVRAVNELGEGDLSKQGNAF